MAESGENHGAAPVYRLDDQIGFLLRRATQRHLGIFGRHVGDMTPTQFAALARLCELDEVSQNALGRQTAMDAATIKGVIDRLRKRGYVASRPDPNDLRRIFVAPTRAGRGAYESHVAGAHAITAETLAPLSPADQTAFLALLRKLT